MDRTFDYAQKILVAVEISAEPSRPAGMPADHSVFRRLSIPEIARVAGEGRSPSAPTADSPAFRAMVNRHMAYWEERVPAGQQCFVHYAIGGGEIIQRTFERLAGAGAHLATLGIYHVEPQSSAYPASFPTAPAPSHWRLGETREFTSASIYWFNFFPAQPYLFEKTFAAWASFQTQNLPSGGGDCNQLVVSDGEGRLHSRGVEDFVQVNLNRFTSLPGFFASATDAGNHTFSADADYRWFGMLLRRL